MKEYFDLFLTFFVIGASAFGGGYSLLPLLERELIKKRGWINMDEVMDYFSIAQVTPGVIAINVSTFVGCKRKGAVGGIIATIAFILPGASLMILASFFFNRFAGHSVISNAFSGIKIAVCALILSSVIKLIKGFFKNYKTAIIFIIAFVLSAVFSISPIFVILGAGLAGFFLFRVRHKKNNAAVAGKSRTGDQGHDSASEPGADKP